MAAYTRLAFAAGLACSVWVQPGHATKVWAAAGFVNNGERTPIALSPEPVLTPAGAQQMLRQGKAFRARYLANLTDEDYGHIDAAHIEKLDADLLDNSLLDLSSLPDEHVTGGAMAFLQGLYPPSREAFRNGDETIGRDYTASSDNFTDYPLNGYQYPNIQSMSYQEPSFASLQGTFGCNAWITAAMGNLTHDPSMEDLFVTTLDWYRELFSQGPLEGRFDLDYANSWNAYEIYDFVNYLYVHNETVHDGLANADSVLERLSNDAITIERARNAYMNGTSSDDNDASDGSDRSLEEMSVVYSIAGRTMIWYIYRQLVGAIRSNGAQDKLALMFGSYQPILSFTTAAGLFNGSSGPFSRLPSPGAAMVFELISDDYDGDDIPAFEKLSLRFLYRANADADADFEEYPLFGLGSEQNGTISLVAFNNLIEDFAVGPYDWCDLCGADLGTPWCRRPDFGDNDGPPRRRRQPGAALIAGLGVASGALFMIIVWAMWFMWRNGFPSLLAPWRRWRRSRANASRDLPPAIGAAPAVVSADRAAGGFKGVEKKEADRDVTVAANGAQHERVGSWEMGGTTVAVPTAPAPTATRENVEPTRTSVQSRNPFDDDDDDTLSILGQTPVKEREGI